MKSFKKFFATSTLLIISALLCCLSFLFLNKGSTAIAEESSITVANYGDVAEPQGLFTKMTLGIKGENGVITATAKNSFTMFNSVIWVFIELYSSTNYQESYTNMELMAIDNIRDLNMGNSISVSVSTNGETRYWQARMRYKFDNNDWVAKTTSTFLYDGNGNELNF